jgi:arylsulfatase A-like enzyme
VAPATLAGLALTGAALGGLAWLGRSVLEALDAARAIPALSVLVAAIGGGVALAPGRRLVLALVPVVALVVVPAATTLARPTPRALVVAFHQRTLGTRLVYDVADRVSPSASARLQADPGKAVSCRPGVAPPSTKAVGKVGASAPDIVLLMVDGMRWDRTPFAGYGRRLMPGLERHAKTGAVFRGYSPASSTRQTFRSLFTGLFPSKVYAPGGPGWGPQIPKEQPTLAALLQAGGYRTFAYLSIRELFMEERGALQGFTDKDWSSVEPNRRRGYSADHTIGRFIADLSAKGDGRPRFLWTHLNEGHSPYPHGPIPEKRFGDKRTDKYDGALRFMDLQIERFLDFALDPARKESTVVVITADHGEGFKEHGTNAGHGWTVYEEEVLVPLVIWGPGIVPGRYQSRVSILDALPTMLELAGLRTQPGHCGRSLAGALRAGKEPTPAPVYMEQIADGLRGGFVAAQVVGDMKVIVYPESGAQELFDLRADPGEKQSLADTKKDAHAAAVRRLVEFYEAHGMDPAAYGL